MRTFSTNVYREKKNRSVIPLLPTEREKNKMITWTKSLIQSFFQSFIYSLKQSIVQFQRSLQNYKSHYRLNQINSSWEIQGKLETRMQSHSVLWPVQLPPSIRHSKMSHSALFMSQLFSPPFPLICHLFH